MLRFARVSGLGKLHSSIGWGCEGPLRAVHVGRGEIVWQDRCDAANGSKEPFVTNAAPFSFDEDQRAEFLKQV